MSLLIKRVKDVKFEDTLFIIFEQGKFEHPLLIMSHAELKQFSFRIDDALGDNDESK